MSGCVLEVWRNVEENGLDELGSSFCLASSSKGTATDSIEDRHAVGGRQQIDTSGQPGWVFGQSVPTAGETENGQEDLGERFLMGERQKTKNSDYEDIS